MRARRLALAGLAAYETQAAAIAASKAEGLRRLLRGRGTPPPNSGTSTPRWTPTTATGPSTP